MRSRLPPLRNGGEPVVQVDWKLRASEPGLAHAFTIEACIAQARRAGRGATGERVHIPITGGVVSGPHQNGRVLPGGSDWSLVRPDGTSQIEATYTIEASDGALILVRNQGLRVSSPEVFARLGRRERVEPSEYYFRGTPVFDAPLGPHQWLTERVFVASLAPTGDRVYVDVYVVT